MDCSDPARGAAESPAHEIDLRPHETSILRPTLEEVREALAALPEPLVAAVGEWEFTFSEAGGQVVSVRLEGSPDGIERIRITGSAVRGNAPNVQRFCAHVAEALRFGLYDPKARRWRDPSAGSVRSGAWRRRLGPLRLVLMAFSAAMVVVAVMAWHAGGRRRDGWLVVVGAGAAVYFALRVWGFLERLKPGGR